MAKTIKNNPLTVALDCDDVLFPCIQKAIEIVNKKYKLDITIDEVKEWLPCGSRADIIMECFNDPTFFETQVPYQGAQEFVNKLLTMCDVYILTAIPIQFMGIRAQIVKKFFPEVSDDHIIMTSSKNLVHIDILLDDGMHNIFSTPAKYPVLMRRPWNQSITGALAVNNYDEFLSLVKQVKERYVETPFDKNVPGIIALVGPSGTGKTTIAEKVIEMYPELFARPKAFTTRGMRPTEDEESYNFVDEKTFKNLVDSGEIFESTIYSGNYYGSSKKEVTHVLNSGKNVIIPLDMCGAIGMKTTFKNATIVYVDRHKRDILMALLSRNSSVEDKTNRLISMPAEEKNAELCDYIITNNNTIEDAVESIIQIVC